MPSRSAETPLDDLLLLPPHVLSSDAILHLGDDEDDDFEDDEDDFDDDDFDDDDFEDDEDDD